MGLSTKPHKARRRRTKDQIWQLQLQIVGILNDDHPQSVRHIFYRMTDPNLAKPVEKSESGYRQVQYQITQLRRKGAIPYGWISDATRRGYHVEMFAGAGDFVRRVAGLYRADLWASSPHYVEVWCESRSIAGVIEDDCSKLAVSLYPAGGFTSITLAYQAAEYINDVMEDPGKDDANIIYIGDYDPAGVLIDRSIENELREHLDLPGGADLIFERIAITDDQIEEYDLPTKPRKAGEKRVRHITKTVEAEAMPAATLRALLRDAIEAFLPEGALEIAKIAEKSERKTLLEMAAALDRQPDAP